jgi:hypothetical protein
MKEQIDEKLEKQQEEIERLKKKSKLQKWINLFLIWK